MAILKITKIILLIILISFSITFAQTFQDQNEGSQLPSSSDNKFTPQQDSSYLNALKLKLPLDVQMRNFISLSDINWQNFLKMQRSVPFRKALDNINNIPAEMLLPRGNDIVQRQEMIEKSFYVPYMNNYSPYGLKIPLNLIGQFLGLNEDISPDIKYKVDYPSDVVVVVYSMQASVICTIFKGKQAPGKYEFTWNGRNDTGKKMIAGDYISEVRISNTQFIRKRIVIN
ncbi:MAG: hypothetical protein NTW25_14890 [Candidatus Kapabacteria bacterium]|nr:hypothetical protein [Candidatus Kapabacteria bacterium]